MNVSETDKKYLKILWYNYLKQKSQTGVTIVENHDFFYEDTGTLIINYFISSRAIPKPLYAIIQNFSRILKKISCKSVHGAKSLMKSKVHGQGRIYGQQVGKLYCKKVATFVNGPMYFPNLSKNPSAIGPLTKKIKPAEIWRFPIFFKSCFLFNAKVN